MFWHLWAIQKCSFLFIFTESNFSSFYERTIMMGLAFFFPLIVFSPKSSSYNYRMFCWFSFPSFPHDSKQNLVSYFSFMVIPILSVQSLWLVFSVMSLVMSKTQIHGKFCWKAWESLCFWFLHPLDVFCGNISRTANQLLYRDVIEVIECWLTNSTVLFPQAIDLDLFYKLCKLVNHAVLKAWS